MSKLFRYAFPSALAVVFFLSIFLAILQDHLLLLVPISVLGSPSVAGSVFFNVLLIVLGASAMAFFYSRRDHLGKALALFLLISVVICLIGLIPHTGGEDTMQDRAHDYLAFIGLALVFKAVVFVMLHAKTDFLRHACGLFILAMLVSCIFYFGLHLHLGVWQRFGLLSFTAWTWVVALDK